MNAELECDGMGCEYEITIPPTIVEMAGGIL
jgi:hypothetical protein